MSRRRTLRVARRVVRQVLADRRTLALLIVVPVLIVLVLGLVLRSGAGQATVYIVAPGAPGTATAPPSPPDSPLAITFVMGTEAEARAALDAGDAAGAIILQPGPQGPVIARVLLEGSNIQANAAVQQFAVRVAGLPAVPLNRMDAPVASRPPFPVEYLRAGPQLDLVDSLAPALIAFFAFFFVFLLSTVALLRERTSGTLERLMASPLRQPELVIGYALGLGLFALLQSVLVTGLSILVLQLDVFGNVGVVFLIALLLTLGAVNLGILASSFARNEFQAVQFIPVVIVPQALLSGAFWPLDGLPGWVQGLARAFPLTYAQEAMREVMVAGRGLADFDVYGRVLVLAGFAAIFIVLGAAGLRRNLA